MDKDEIRSLLGDNIFYRAVKLCKNVRDIEEDSNSNKIRHLKAVVDGQSGTYKTQIWLRPSGTLISGSCSCPYNCNGDGPLCKHIGALLLVEVEASSARSAAPDNIPGVQRGASSLRRSDYSSSLDMLFGKKWRAPEPTSDAEAVRLLYTYQNGALADVDTLTVDQARGFVSLEPDLTPPTHPGSPAMLRLRISGGGRWYVVKSIKSLLDAIDSQRSVSYGRALAFVHRPDAFDAEAEALLRLVRRAQNAIDDLGVSISSFSYTSTAPAGSIPLTADLLDALADWSVPSGLMGGYILKEGMPTLTLHAAKRRGGAALSITPSLTAVRGAASDYLFSNDNAIVWRISDGQAARALPALQTLSMGSVFFTQHDATDFCSFVLPELGDKLTIDDPDRLLLNQIPLRPVVQFYLDSTRTGVTAHAEFLYGEDRVTPRNVPPNLLRDARTERRAQRLLSTYLSPSVDCATEYAAYDDETICAFLDDGVPALLAEGEVYLSDAFRNMQLAPPKISVGVSVHGSVLDLDVDTGDFPVAELKALLSSLHAKKRYHRLRDGRLLRLDESLDVLDELNETLELSGAHLGQRHAQLPLYRAPSLDWALSGQSGVRFDRDDAFRRISRSFHAVKDSEYTPPASLQKVLRKYQRDGYRWLRTLDSYGMGGILADDMGLGKTVQVLSYLLAIKQQPDPERPRPSLIVCPASLVLNWAEECKKFTPELTCITVDGTAAQRAALAEQWADTDLVVTSYDLLRRDEALYEAQPFYACILDEAQAVKNHATQKYKAVCKVNSRVRFALTGTPVENRLGELWSIFSFLMPGYLPPYKSFCARFEKPIVQDDDKDAARRLTQLTGPFILRRMKAEVLTELPPKTENVCRVEFGDEQRKLYLAAVVDAREKLRAASNEDKMAVFAVLTRLREICCDPRLIADNWHGDSAKLDACAELVSTAVEGGHRILLFSQFTSMLALLAQRLDEAGITHFTLQGSTPKPERADLVRRFNAGEVNVFLISLRAGGTGLNLTAADIVIHYDPWWNLAAQNQATDRAYRIGQRNPVQVYKLIVQDTIEEKIVELQQAKQSLADTVTGTADGAILSMKPEELLALLEDQG